MRTRLLFTLGIFSAFGLVGCGTSTVVGVGDGDGGHADAGPGNRDAGPADGGPDAHDAGPEDAGPLDAGPLDAGPEDAGFVDGGCFAPGDPDGLRWVVVSHPYLPDAGRSPDYEVLALSPSGELAKAGARFQMRRSSVGHIAFTPDGRFGFAPQEDGTIGEFELFEDGGVQVLDDGFGGFYARAVTISADGFRGYVNDPDTLANGGGVYAFDVACDGTLGSPALQGSFNTPDALAFLHGSTDRAVVAGGAALGSADSDDVHLVDFGAGGPGALGSAVVFLDGGAIPSAVAVTEDDAYALVADDGIFAGNRIGVVRIEDGGLTPVDVLGTPNPADVATSPFGNAALILNSDGTDGITILGYDPANVATPFTLQGQIDYVAPYPQLPAEAAVIRRGALTGRVLIGELSGVRQVQFERDGGVTDLSVDNGNGSFEGIVGAMGVQP